MLLQFESEVGYFYQKFGWVKTNRMYFARLMIEENAAEPKADIVCLIARKLPQTIKSRNIGWCTFRIGNRTYDEFAACLNYETLKTIIEIIDEGPQKSEYSQLE